MAIDPPALPEHPDDLREYCLRLLTELAEKDHHIEKLRHELELFKRTSTVGARRNSTPGS